MKLFTFLFTYIYIISFGSFLCQSDESYKVYDDSEVAVIKITMDQNDLEWMFSNSHSDSMHLARVHFKNSQIDEIVDSVGIRIRGNTSRESFKKSLKLSFNTFIRGGKFYSLEKLNLNGEHNDPSIARSKICWDFFNAIGIKSSRAAHAAVYMNDQYYGLYISVEHIDENFVSKNYDDDTGNLWKCLFGADLNYISSDPNSYKIGSVENRVYDLKTNRSADDYSKLAELIDFINNSDHQDFQQQISQKINLLETLQYFAFNILSGSWDDYWALSNNYYLYHEPSYDIFHLIPYDYDNTFGISWFETDWASVSPYTFGKVVDGPRPLIEKILEVPEFHNLYTHILTFFTEIRFETSLAGNRINDLKNLITPWAMNDTYRVGDYGFSIDDFNNSFFLSGYSNMHVRYSINDFIKKRHESLENQLFFVDADPIIYDYKVYPQNPQPEESLLISCSAFSNIGITSVMVNLQDLNNQTHKYEMNFVGDLGSLDIRMRDLWQCEIDALGDGFVGTIQFIVTDTNGDSITYPQDGYEIRTPGDVTKEVILSELMSSNISTIQDNAGEYDDWLEIYNPHDTAVSLSGKYLTDKINNLTKWQFPDNVTIQPNQFILIWCDEDQEQSGPHINFKLNSDGEFVAIVDNDGITIVDSVTLPALSADQSYSRNNNIEEWYISTMPTPGESNLLTNVQTEINERFNFRLEAYPNPFNPSTTIEYEIAKTMNLQLRIFDVLGRTVWQTEKQKKEAGRYLLHWSGNDNGGND
ncbi:MAG: CotH kinase family protein, partial [Melioribacteraceae bacterium]|nr:CotH kinase family protein [Melioribacteraceae bacterium]